MHLTEYDQMKQQGALSALLQKRCTPDLWRNMLLGLKIAGVTKASHVINSELRCRHAFSSWGYVAASPSPMQHDWVASDLYMRKLTSSTPA